MARYLPSLSFLITLDELPNSLDFIKTPLQNVFSNLYYKELYTSSDFRSKKVVHSLKIVTPEKLSFDLGNTGFSLVVNPSHTPGGTSEIPITIAFSWPILSVIRDFDLDSFDFSIRAMFDLVLEFSGATEEEVLVSLVNNIYYPEEDGNSPISAFKFFIDDFNTNNSPATDLVFPNTEDEFEAAEEILIQLSSNGNSYNIIEVIFTDYLTSDDSYGDVGTKLERIFSDIFGSVNTETISRIVLPYFSGSINNLTIALEFPKNILKPLNNNGEVIEDEKSKLEFSVGAFRFNTESGFSFENASSLSLYPTTSQIGNTGLTVGFTGARLDLNDRRNIPEADADGRDVAFKGVFIQSATIGIPWIKDSNGNNLEIAGTNLLLGNPGGISGTIGLGANLTGKLPGGIDVTLKKFDLAFHQNSITGSEVELDVKIPGLKTSGGNDAVLLLKGAYQTTVNPDTNEIETGFAASVTIPSGGLTLKIGDSFEIKLKGFGMSKWENGPLTLSFVADFKFLSKPSFIGDMLPDAINVNPIVFETGSGVKSFAIELDWANAENTKLVYENDVLDANIPIDKTILGFITLVAMRATISNHPNGEDKKFRLLVDAGLKIGPVYGSAKDFGIEADLNFRQNKIGESGNNDQPIIDNLTFVPPNGIGLAVDATAVKGAGFLSLDHVNQRYSGALSLTILEKIDLLAYGVLVTKMPDGSNGFSMVAVMSVVFNPTIPLAFGFTLNGLGGLLGLHRSANAEYLRSGLIDGSVGDLMFPVNPAPRLMQIISNLESAFPVHKDRFVFGPAAKIGWGAPSLITIDLALIIELPAPVRLYILGVVRALLPDEKKPILQLQINFLGVIDFAKKSVAFDAALFDSKLLTFKLSGTMAFRMIGGSNPYFLMTVGGFHPAFKIPPLNLPAQQRLGLSLVNSGNFKLGATTYFAITSNSVQFGAAIALSASLGVFAITGGFGFDVLIIFNPFSFVAAMSAGLAISGKLPVIKIRIRRILRISVRIEWRSINLASVSLSGTIQGPSEWIVKGKATFSALGTSYSFDVNKQWGKKEHITIPSIDLMPRLLAELDKDINWQIESGKAAKQSVVIREIPEGTFVFNSSGQLQIQQNLLPLKLNIEKYGNAKPKSDNRFEITDIKLGNPQRFMQASLVDTKDFFAPGEYKNYSKAQKLSLPAFQKFNNGVQAKAPNAAGAFDYGNYTQHRVMVYEEKYIDTTGDGNDNTAIGENSLKSSLNTTLNSALEAETANLFLKGNAAAKYRRKNNLVQFTRTDHSFLVNEDRYAIVDCRDLTIHDVVGESFWGTLMEAEEEMEILLKNNPALAGQITVIAEFEMAA